MTITKEHIGRSVHNTDVGSKGEIWMVNDEEIAIIYHGLKLIERVKHEAFPGRYKLLPETVYTSQPLKEKP